MGLFSAIFGTREERVLKKCVELYEKAQEGSPGKSERDYLKIVLITKPPFDYVHDGVLDKILDSCGTIQDLARQIARLGQVGSRLWEHRSRNIKLGHLESRNREFFSYFWDDSKRKSEE